jgi:hypothetical protein
MMTTHEFNLTTKNTNFMSSTTTLAKRRMSRQSAETFNTVDFNVIGDTNVVNHLIHKRIGGLNPNPT